jgi:chromosome segregation ATPase
LFDKIPTIIGHLELEAEKHRLEKINSIHREKLASLKQNILEKRNERKQEQITQLKGLIMDFHYWKKIKKFNEYLNSWSEDQKEKNKDLYELGQSFSNWIDPFTKKPIPGLNKDELRELENLFLKH